VRGGVCGRFDFGKGMCWQRNVPERLIPLPTHSSANFSVAVLSERVLRGRRGDPEAGTEGHTARDEKTAEAGGSE
jgi:hypothetical protein